MTQPSGDYTILKILKCFILFCRFVILLVTVTSKLFDIAQFSVLLSSTICSFCEKDINLKERQSVICIPMNEFSHCLVKSLFDRFLASSLSMFSSFFRYEIFMDEVKPQDLSLSFLREFMNLPNSYFEAGAPLKYRE